MEKICELVVLLHPDLEIDVEAPIKKIESIIKSNGGIVVKMDNWGKKRLAYRIKKQDFAVYVYFEVKIDPSKVREIENTLLITEEVLRHMIVSHEESAKPETAKSEKSEKTEQTEETKKDEESK